MKLEVENRQLLRKFYSRETREQAKELIIESLNLSDDYVLCALFEVQAAHMERQLKRAESEFDSWRRSSIQDGSCGASWAHNRGDQKRELVKKINEFKEEK